MSKGKTMLKYAIIAGIIGLAANQSLAQDFKSPTGDIPTMFTRTPCNELSKLVDSIKPYDETLLFTGDGMTFSAQTGQPFRGGMMFYTNQDTGTWSLLQLFGDGYACLIMNGNKFTPYSGN